MLGKLIKYENKALSKIILPLGIGVLLISVFAAVMLKLDLSFGDWLGEGNSVTTVLEVASSVLFGFSVVAIASACFVSLFLVMQRYYKNLFTDEGYLTFTLPVKTTQIVISKAISAALWMIFSVVCVLAAAFVIAVFGTGSGFVNMSVLRGIGAFFDLLRDFAAMYSAWNISLFILEYVLIAVVGLFEQFMLIYLAITVGNQIAKRHKILGSILAYFVINAICQTINSILLVLFGSVFENVEFFFENGNLFDNGAMHIVLLGGILLAVLYTAAFFFINCYILKNKLNIE